MSQGKLGGLQLEKERKWILFEKLQKECRTLWKPRVQPSETHFRLLTSRLYVPRFVLFQPLFVIMCYNRHRKLLQLFLQKTDNFPFSHNIIITANKINNNFLILSNIQSIGNFPSCSPYLLQLFFVAKIHSNKIHCIWYVCKSQSRTVCTTPVLSKNQLLDFLA